MPFCFGLFSFLLLDLILHLLFYFHPFFHLLLPILPLGSFKLNVFQKLPHLFCFAVLDTEYFSIDYLQTFLMYFIGLILQLNFHLPNFIFDIELVVFYFAHGLLNENNFIFSYGTLQITIYLLFCGSDTYQSKQYRHKFAGLLVRSVLQVPSLPNMYKSDEFVSTRRLNKKLLQVLLMRWAHLSQIYFLFDFLF